MTITATKKNYKISKYFIVSYNLLICFACPRVITHCIFLKNKFELSTLILGCNSTKYNTIFLLCFFSPSPDGMVEHIRSTKSFVTAFQQSCGIKVNIELFSFCEKESNVPKKIREKKIVAFPIVLHEGCVCVFAFVLFRPCHGFVSISKDRNCGTQSF